MNTAQGAKRQHVVDDLNRVMAQDADVFKLMVANAFQQCSNAGLVNLAAKEIGVWQNACNVGTGFTHAKANLQHGGRLAVKCPRKIHRFSGVGQQVLGADRLIGFGLSQGGAASAQHIALDGSAKGDAAVWLGRKIARQGSGFCHLGGIVKTPPCIDPKCQRIGRRALLCG